MTSANGRPAWLLTLLVAWSLVMLGPLGPVVAGNPRAAAKGATTRPFVLPIPPGQTWHVCQGYNGDLTHAGIPALDLSRARQSIGSKGCLAGSKYSSAGSIVSSPAAGTAYRWPGCCGDDFVCVNFDSGGSAAIGHLDHRVPDGTRVRTGDRIGTVAWPRSWNGEYAHIHVQVHPRPNCTEGSDPVAFDVAHGFKWACSPDLPYSGAPNQYSGLSLSRCDSAGDKSDRRNRNARIDAPTSAAKKLRVRLERSTWVATFVRLMRLLVMSASGLR